jgi:hypothetical protein
LPTDDEYVVVKGKGSRQKITDGWQFNIQCKDGTTSLDPLRTLKEANPVEIAECAVANKISSIPTFVWWLPFTIQKRDRIVEAVNKRYLSRTHKFGIAVPKIVAEALDLHRISGTMYWRDAINLEAKNLDGTFQELEEDEQVPVGYQFVKCHMFFDVKVGSLKRKVRYVAGVHMTEALSAITYASVVSRESIRIGLLLAALNDLEVFVADIQNEYLTSP